MPIYLKVPYVEKDQAKALGARWDAENRSWYVPEGMLLSSFECWLDDLLGPRIEKKSPTRKPRKKKPAPARVDSYVGKTITGSRFVKLPRVCECSPWSDCDKCKVTSSTKNQ